MFNETLRASLEEVRHACIMGEMSTMRILAQPQFRRIFLAQSVSTLGDNVAPIAIAFAVLATTHSGVSLGLVLAARTLPMALFVVLGGAWADRLPRKSVMVVADLLRLGTQGAFALLLLSHSPALWSFMLLQAVNGTATAFFRPASSGLIQEAVQARDRQGANALLSATSNISAIAGPAIAAILIAFVGNAAAVGIDALTFGVSGLFLFGVTVSPRAAVARLGIWKEIAEGFRAVTARPWLAVQICAFAEFQLFVLASFSVLGPLVSDRIYQGATTWALVASLSAIGALAGDAISTRYKPRLPLIAANAISLACIPVLVALALGAPVPIVAICGFLFGLSSSIPDTLWFTALQNNVPEHLMARVSAFDWMGSMILRPVGLAVVAPIAVILGPGVVLVIAGGVTAATLVATMIHPSIRRLTDTTPEDSDHRDSDVANPVS